MGYHAAKVGGLAVLLFVMTCAQLNIPFSVGDNSPPDTATDSHNNTAMSLPSHSLTEDDDMDNATETNNSSNTVTNDAHTRTNETNITPDQTNGTKNKGMINITIGDTDFSVCHSWSCKDRCFSQTGLCRCDELCVFAGDCCVDFLSQCRNISDFIQAADHIRLTLASGSNSGPVDNPNLAYFAKSYAQCIDADVMTSGVWKTPELLSVISCPVEFANVSVKTDCENYSLSLPPVSHSYQPTLVFRNMYCAECHGYGMNITTRWSSVLRCSGLDMTESSVDEVIEAYKKGRCAKSYVPPEPIEKNKSRMNSKTISRLCVMTEIEAGYQFKLSLNNSHLNSSCSENDVLFCSAHMLPVWVNGNDTDIFTAKNPHCLKCRTDYVLNEFFKPCGDVFSSDDVQNSEENQITFKGITKLFYLSEDESGVEIGGQLVAWPGLNCTDDEVYDHENRVCRKLTCFTGYVLLDQKCVPSNMVVDGHTQLLGNGTDSLSIQVWLPQSLSCQSVMMMDPGIYSPLSSFLQYQLSNIFDELDSEISCSDDNRKLHILFTFTPDVDFTELYNDCMNLFENFPPDFSDMPVNVTLSNSDPQISNVTSVCPDGVQPVTYDDTNVTERDNKLFVNLKSQGVQQLYPLENVPFTVVLSYQKSKLDDMKEEQDKEKDWDSKPNDSETSDNIAGENTPDQQDGFEEDTEKETKHLGEEKENFRQVIKAIICEQHISNSSISCVANAYPKNQTRIENGSLTIQGTDTVFDEDEYEVRDDEVLVCSRFKNYNFWDRLDLFNINPNQKYVVFGLGVFSIVSLVFVLIVYCLLPELRTLPGKILMSLVACLLAGHLTLIIDIQNKTFCRVIAVLAHFTWLAAFAWMSAIAVHMATTFFSLSAHKKTLQEAIRAFYRYSLVCWGLPLVLVATCLTLDAIPSISFTMDYGHKVCGWIGNGKANIWTFFIPLGVSLAVNLLAFLAAVIGIERTTRVSRMVNSRRSEGRRLLVYVKMSAALGFTWLLGLGVAFEPQAWIVWTFTILNSLQGTFIALAFIVNERVTHMLTKKITGKFKGKHLSSTSELKSGTDSTLTTSVSDSHM